MLETTLFTQHFPYLGLFVLFVLGVIGFPFPEDGILILSGFLTAHHVIKPLPAFLVVYFSLLMTDFFLYSVGKKYGRSLVEHKRFHRIMSPDRLSKLEERFEKWGGLVVFLGRHLLGLRAQIFLVAGIMRMSGIKFFIADATSALLTITLWGGIGYVGGNSIQTLRKDLSRIEHLAIVCLAVMIVSGIIFNYFKKRRSKLVEPLLPEARQGDHKGTASFLRGTGFASSVSERAYYSLMKNSVKGVLILLFPFLLSCATTGQLQQYSQGSITDMGHYSGIGPQGQYDKVISDYTKALEIKRTAGGPATPCRHRQGPEGSDRIQNSN